jgi:hypothetical protein
MVLFTFIRAAAASSISLIISLGLASANIIILAMRADRGSYTPEGYIYWAITFRGRSLFRHAQWCYDASPSRRIITQCHDASYVSFQLNYSF